MRGCHSFDYHSKLCCYAVKPNSIVVNRLVTIACPVYLALCSVLSTAKICSRTRLMMNVDVNPISIEEMRRRAAKVRISLILLKFPLLAHKII